MNIFYLKCFIVVADTLNFTKAAERLNMSQSALSKAISSMENEIGHSLFRRDKRSVYLTALGKQFFTDARHIVYSYESALENVSIISKQKKGLLTLGFYGYSSYDFLSDIINNFTLQYPDIAVNLIDGSCERLTTLFKAERLDACILPDVKSDFVSPCVTATIYKDEYSIVVPSDHYLANSEHVSLATLANETFIVLNQHRDFLGQVIPNSNVVQKIFSHLNFSPKRILGCAEIYNIPVYVACHKGISILAKHMKKYSPASVRFLDFDHSNIFYNSKLIWHEHNQSPCLDKFIDFLKKSNPEFNPVKQ